jgi:hypothetical protein
MGLIWVYTSKTGKQLICLFVWCYGLALERPAGNVRLRQESHKSVARCAVRHTTATHSQLVTIHHCLLAADAAAAAACLMHAHYLICSATVYCAPDCTVAQNFLGGSGPWAGGVRGALRPTRA